MSNEGRPKFRGIVEYLRTSKSDEALKVAIAPYAALYSLDKHAERFAEWLGILEKSCKERRKIAFTYDILDLHLTSVELLE